MPGKEVVYARNAMPETDKIKISPVTRFRRRILSVDFGDDISTYLVPEEEPQPKPHELSWWQRRIEDVWVIASLAARLYAYLFTGIRWYFKFLRLILFSVILLPGFTQMIAFYFFSPRLHRSISYSPKPRNRLDVYLPRKKWRGHGKKCSVVIYVTGGAWTIGYKAWGALFGRRLSQRGVLVFCLDYRNFPQGKLLDMLCDVNTGIRWVFDNLKIYGGDPDSVFLVGQSAGGHLTSLALLSQAQRSSRAALQSSICINTDFNNDINDLYASDGYKDDCILGGSLGGSPVWDPMDLKGYVGVSGAYNLITLADHLHKRGLYRHLFESIMAGPDGSPMLRELSPTLVAKNDLTPAAAAQLPHMLLLHGTADKSVPIENAREYYEALLSSGVNCALKEYKGKTHTQPIIEDPMRGGRDVLMDNVLSLIRGQECVNIQFPMLPSAFIDLATWVCPF